jgi:hypothetical protein
MVASDITLRGHSETVWHFNTEEGRANSFSLSHRVNHLQSCYMHILKYKTISSSISLSVTMLWRYNKLLFQRRIYFRPSNCSVNSWRSNGLLFRTKVKMLCAANDNKYSLVFKRCFMLRSVGTQFCFGSVDRLKFNCMEVKEQPGFKSGCN